MGESSACRSCKQEIVWGTTPAGKRIPLDAKPVKRVILTDQGMHGMFMLEDVEHVAHPNVVARIVDTFTPHHAPWPRTTRRARRPRSGAGRQPARER